MSHATDGGAAFGAGYGETTRSGSASALVQDPGESLPPARAEARSDFDLIGQLGPVVHPEP
jgi:hypothetical protein